MTVLTCFCTIDSREAAENLASALVAEHLVACVNIIEGVSSVYRWQGKVEQDPELLLILKTTEERLAQLKTRVAELHPYDVPELLALTVQDGLAPYMQWVADEVSD